MPRKSAAALALGPLSVDGRPKRLQPPNTLSDREQVLFVDLVASSKPEHFRPSDLPLLCRYVEASCLAQQAAQELRLGAVVGGKPSPWITVQEKALRAMTALSMRLRLSPQSRIDSKTVGRARVNTGPKLWEMRKPPSEDDEAAE
jgi:phage terminase small subunit